MVKKKTAGPRYVPQQQFAWIEYRNPEAEEGASPLLARVRTDLSLKEVNTIVFDAKTPMTEVWDKVAPFVIDWNVDDIDGNPISPPSVAGGRQFDLISNALFWKIFEDLKIRSGGSIEAKRLAPSRSSEPTDGDTNTNVTSVGEPENGAS